MKPNNPVNKSKLSLSKQTISKLDKNNMHTVQAGNASNSIIPITITITISLVLCNNEN
jgi:hypothetical protein